MHCYRLFRVIVLDIKRVFGTNVRFYRERKGLTQEELAEKSELHRTYISDIERFQRSISLSNIQKIADALGVAAYRLFMEGPNNELQTDKRGY